MAIKRIKISNFKSFKDLDINLGKFNVLIGANASGKSNFVQIFRFLMDITKDSLDDAISMQGDIRFFRNINIGPSMNFSMEIFSDQEMIFGIPTRNKREFIGIKSRETIYRFALEFYKRKAGFKIAEDKLRIKIEFLKLEEQKGKINEKGKLGEKELRLAVNDRRKIMYDFNIPDGVPLKIEELIPISIIKKEILPPKMLLLETPYFHIPFPVASIFRGISIYNFDPKLPKKATPISGKKELEEDGSNLAIVLNNIIRDKGEERNFSNLLKDTLSFVKDLDIERSLDKSLLIKLREIYSKEDFLPASLISDGTINITALIIALYFGRKRESLIIVEEPERNIHPYLISKVVDMMKEVSEKKQIIITTHNPEIVKYANLEDILLISRDKEGFSKISRPCEKKEVKTFLKNEIGVEELYVQNLLEL